MYKTISKFLNYIIVVPEEVTNRAIFVDIMAKYFQ